jgi:hypothetical protein
LWGLGHFVSGVLLDFINEVFHTISEVAPSPGFLGDFLYLYDFGRVAG